MCKNGSQIAANLATFFGAQKKILLRDWKTFKHPRVDPEIMKTLCVIVKGESGIGKSAWARNHFKKPLIVKHMDDFKKFRDHDGIVVDDLNFNHCPIETHIHLTSVTEERPIHCRHVNGEIGPVPLFITCNPQRFPPVALDDGAVARRCHVIEFIGPNVLYCKTPWNRMAPEIMELIWGFCWGAVFIFHKNHKERYPKHYEEKPEQGPVFRFRTYTFEAAWSHALNNLPIMPTIQFDYSDL